MTTPLTIVFKAATAIPASFDCLWQIQNLLILQRISGHSSLRVFFAFDRYEPSTGAGAGAFIDNVIRPMLSMFGIVEVKHIEGTYYDGGMAMNMSGATGFYEKSGIIPTPWRVNEESIEWASAYNGAVVITIRQADHLPERNSDLYEWMRAAEILRDRGEKVVFVPDTKRLDHRVGPFVMLPEAAIDLRKRAALYQAAKANLSITNGPLMLCACMRNIPYLMIQTRATIEKFERYHSKFVVVNYGSKQLRGSRWRMWHGFDKGEDGPNFRGPQQLWIWDEDKADVIVRGFDRIMHKPAMAA